MLFIELTAKQARYLLREKLDPSRDTDFEIGCRLHDALIENRYRSAKMQQPPKEATMGVGKYADAGVQYYRKAALAQMVIGVASIIQALSLVAIAAMLAIQLI